MPVEVFYLASRISKKSLTGYKKSKLESLDICFSFSMDFRLISNRLLQTFEQFVCISSVEVFYASRFFLQSENYYVKISRRVLEFTNILTSKIIIKSSSINKYFNTTMTIISIYKYCFAINLK